MNPYSEQASNQTPDSQVAAEIVEMLMAEKLISTTQAAEIFKGLKSGRLKEADWQLIAEIALEKEARHER